MDINFRRVNGFLITQGRESFPFDLIHLDVADENTTRETTEKFNNLLLNWLTE